MAGRPRRIVVVGTAAFNPYAGMAWMHMQIVVGLLRMGHDAYYFETSSAWPYDPVRQSFVGDSEYAVPYLERIAREFGIADRWAYRRSYGDKAWFGMPRREAEDLLANADAVLNVSGATRMAEEGLDVGRLVYFGTDPGYHEMTFAMGDEDTKTIIDEHDEFVTYGENIGTPESPIPPLPNLRARTRQPVLLDYWTANGTPPRPAYTTVANWQHAGRDVEYEGVPYHWSKHHEMMKFIELPRRIRAPIEFATGVGNLSPADRDLLERNGWRVVDAHTFTTEPGPYRDYIVASRGEFTVAKDQNVRLRSGWFSERSACYLAAGRPVVTQDTGFGTVLPTGEGLFACADMDEAMAAFEAIESDYERHSRAARAIAEEHFAADRVLTRLLDDLGLSS